MSDAKKPPVAVTFNHDPVVLRVDEMVDGEIPGSKVAKLVGEIPLARGRNEVDADLWAKWKIDNKDGAMAALIHEEQSDDEA